MSAVIVIKIMWTVMMAGIAWLWVCFAAEYLTAGRRCAAHPLGITLALLFALAAALPWCVWPATGVFAP
jgi:hypothetical protein